MRSRLVEPGNLTEVAPTLSAFRAHWLLTQCAGSLPLRKFELSKRVGAEIYFWDESGFRADAVQGGTGGSKGQTPVVAVPGKRQSISAASAVVNSKGSFWFATYQGGMSADLFVAMFKHIM